MSFLHKVNKVTIFGTAFGGLEEWSTGFYMGAVAADAGPPSQATADSIRDEWVTFWNTGVNEISNQYAFKGVKVATLGTDGKTILDSVVTSFTAADDFGTRVGAAFPPQIALVASLLSAPGTGIARKGRMYLPGVNQTLGSDAHLTSATPTSLCNTLATFFTNINGDADVPDTVILASKGRAPQPSIGLNRVVESVKVGNVYDTQRRRRNQLVETYVSAAVVN